MIPARDPLDIELERRYELAEQDKLWKEKRMVSGHGAQDGSARDPNYKALIVVIGGPISHWWDENWMSPEHIRYDEWRTKVEEAMIAAGFLVYKPYTAFKGTWNEEAQRINNAVISIADVLLVLTPDGVPSEGTDEEIEHAEQVGTKIVYTPPPLATRDGSTLDKLTETMMVFADLKNGKKTSLPVRGFRSDGLGW